MTPKDTSEDSRTVQADTLRRMSGEERIALAISMSEDARTITCDGIRHCHPDWSEARVRREMLTRAYGEELVRAAWGPCPS